MLGWKGVRSMELVKSRYNWVWFVQAGILFIFTSLSLLVLYRGLMRKNFDWRLLTGFVIFMVFYSLFIITEVTEDAVVLKSIFGVNKIKFSDITKISKSSNIYPSVAGFDLRIYYGLNRIEIVPLRYYSNFINIRTSILLNYNLATGKEIAEIT
jgi:hypothetical protein